MTPLGVEVQRSTIPTSIELSKDESELTDPTSYPVRVVLERLDKFEDGAREEIVHAKFVVGCDGAFPRCQHNKYNHFLSIGAHSWIRKQVDITMDGEQSGENVDHLEFSASSVSNDRFHMGCRGHGHARH
jgi:phenol 2-monooxygenase